MAHGMDLDPAPRIDSELLQRSFQRQLGNNKEDFLLGGQELTLDHVNRLSSEGAVQALRSLYQPCMICISRSSFRSAGFHPLELSCMRGQQALTYFRLFDPCSLVSDVCLEFGYFPYQGQRRGGHANRESDLCGRVQPIPSLSMHTGRTHVLGTPHKSDITTISWPWTQRMKRTGTRPVMPFLQAFFD